MSPSARQTSYDLLCRVLRGVLRDAVQAGPGAAGGIGTVECQAVATLYLLLMDHPIDQRGRCRSCRRPGAVFGPRWRRCRVHAKANMCLHQLDEVLLLRLLAYELGLATPTPPAAPGRAPARDPDGTEVLPAIAADPSTEPLQTPAVPSSLPPRGPRGAGRPDRDHGGVGNAPESPRPRCGPSEDPLPSPGRSSLRTGGIT